MTFSDHEPVAIPSNTVLEPGDMFVFPMDISEENLLPFGIGCVIEHEKNGYIHFQWMSNFNQNQLAKFLPMWFQPSDKKAYYKLKPMSNTHPPYTGKDLGVFVKVDDLILVFSETPFLEENILKPGALHFILQNDLVKQALGDFERVRKTQSA